MALSKPGTKRSKPLEKRAHSEVADSSLGDEVTSLQKQLDQLTSDIKCTRDDVKNLMKKRGNEDLYLHNHYKYV